MTVRSDLQKLKFFCQPTRLTEILHQDENKKHNLSIDYGLIPMDIY